MTSPYINTYLYSTVPLAPYQMQNDLYLNLKDNLKNHVEGRCYLDYGYLDKVYKIMESKSGVIDAENIHSTAMYDVKFSCKLCCPVVNQQLVCKVDNVSKVLITATNGPIMAIIPINRVNSNVFYTDRNNRIRYRTDKDSDMLKKGDFVKLTTINIIFHDRDTKIKTVAFLDDIASEDDIKAYYDDIYDNEKPFVNVGEYRKTKEEEVESKKAADDKAPVVTKKPKAT